MEQQTAQAKHIPYGMQNWEDVRLDNYYYVDKTRFIPKIEAANRYFFFIRPRRFGKSLLLNMLRQYYDVRKADLFDRLFGDLWIGSHPTPMHNKYLVLHLNFAMFSGDLAGYKERMDDYCNTQYVFFIDQYADLLPPDAQEKLREKSGAANQLDALIRICKDAGQQMYLFIDEYDHFTNAILSESAMEQGYKAETHGTGAFRAFFDTIKGGTDTALKRLFVTGVSPVTMVDLTSGFNIGTNYTSDELFNELVGFTEQEVRQMLDYYRQYYTFQHTTDELIEAMRPWYDNYRFSINAESTMFNSDMVLYFLFRYRDHNGRFPDKMLDSNIRMDYSRLRMLIRKDPGFEHDASIIQQIVETGGITAELKDSFPSETITNPDNFVSLLYYFGMLTIEDEGERGGIKFRIPNQTVREQIYTYLIETYRDNQLYMDDRKRSDLMGDMAYDGNWRPYFEYVAETLQAFASNRDRQKGEAFVHGFTLAQTCLLRGYLPISELDAGAGHGFADIYLQPLLNIYRKLKHSYLIELKYLPAKATDAEVKAARQQAVEQLTRYGESVQVERTVFTTQLHRLILLWRGMELAVAEEL